MSKLAAYLALVLVTGFSLATAKPFPPVDFENDFSGRQQSISYRLPNDTHPISYKVHLDTRVDLEDFVFTGEVQITIGVSQPTRSITIHALNMTIDTVALYKKGTPDTPVDINEPTLNEANDFLVITTKTEQLVAANEYILVIQYWSELRGDEAGFYKASYVDNNGVTKYLATTQFESTDARHAFPCYDEPRLRSTFDISITHGKAYSAVSNMPVKITHTVDDETVTTVFETTVNMATYLLAFVVSDYAYLEDKNSKPYQRAYSQPNKIEDTHYVLKAGVDIMKALEGYLNVGYSLPKMDQFGINQFAAGAMENWGLVTYRSPYFHWNEKTSTSTEQMNVASIVAHEYAHQWFGNLVTPKWWTYLWLNEGFATLYEHEAVELAYPEMRFSDLWSIWVVQTVFAVDSADTTRPMTHYAESPRGISALFDRVAYPKSGSVLRMIKNFVTEPVWKKGLEKYLTEMSFKAAEPEDLFRNLQLAVNEGGIKLPVDIKIILDTWTTRRGYPLVTAHRLNDDKGSIHITQSRFMDATKKDPEAITYYVPVNIASKGTPEFADTTAHFWFNGLDYHFVPEADSKLNVPKADWLLLNKRQAYYYRVNYDDDNWLLLADELNKGDFNKIDLLNRAQLVDDAFDLARFDHLDYTVAMHIVKYLIKEQDYIPWAAADNGLTELYRLMRDSDTTSGLFMKFVRELIEPVYKKLGVARRQPDDHLTRLHRNLAIKWACRTGSEECLKDTLAVMKTVVNDGVVVEPDLKATTFCHGMRSADAELFEKFLGQAAAAADATTRNAILNALGCNENEAVLESAIAKMIDGNSFTAAEKRLFINSAFANSATGYHTVVHYAAGDESDKVKTLYGSLYASFLNNLAGYATTQHYKEDLVALMNKYDDISAANKATINNRIEANLAFVKENGKEVASFLDDHYPGAAASVIASFAMVIVAALTSYSLF